MMAMFVWVQLKESQLDPVGGTHRTPGCCCGSRAAMHLSPSTEVVAGMCPAGSHMFSSSSAAAADTTWQRRPAART